MRRSSTSGTRTELEVPPPSSKVTLTTRPALVDYRYVPVDQYRPNVDGWQTFGNVASYERVGPASVLLENEAGHALQITFVSDLAVRVQFRPGAGERYRSDAPSYAVVNRELGPVRLTLSEVNRRGPTLRLETRSLTMYVGLQPYGMAIYREGQLVTEDAYGKNVIFSGRAVACLRKAPSDERYYGLGERAGASLDKKHYTMTCFNHHNPGYSGNADDGLVPHGNEPGPLNPSEPGASSIPFVLAVGDADGEVGSYAYGILLDNAAQSYFNMGASDYSDMSGKYYLGALYGDLDYYVLVGDGAGTRAIRSVLRQYASLTGHAAMPPKYAFGYHQGCHGYCDAPAVLEVARAYRKHQIPIDGLYIGVDFQNNHRTFTTSARKFPNAAALLGELHDSGFKCGTTITPVISANPLDEVGEHAEPYPARDAFVGIGADGAPSVRAGARPPFLYDRRAGQPESGALLVANVSYGDDDPHVYPGRKNPYPYPTPLHPQGQPSLGTHGFFPDAARPDVRQWWGEQFAHWLDIGMDMIAADMTCPLLRQAGERNRTLPLDVETYDAVTDQQQPMAVVHNAYGLNLVRASAEGMAALRASNALFGTYNAARRGFLLARGGFAGLQRHAALWAGSSASSWDYLRIVLPQILNLGLSGQALAGSDIGGFGTGSASGGQGVTDAELLTRWMNLGAFLPFYRNHYDGYTKLFQEPYRYGEPVLTNCRRYIELRYRLIQLFYDAMFENTRSGLPICRALFVNDAEDPRVFLHSDDQFFVGDSLLVAPIVNPGQLHRDVYLPLGSDWYVFNDGATPLGAPTPGGTTQNWYAPPGVVPLYVRDGAIIPMRAVEQYVGQAPAAPLTFHIYPGRDTTYTLYQDDEVSTANVERQAYRVSRVSHQATAHGCRVRVQRLEDRFTPKAGHYRVALLGSRQPAAVQLRGAPLCDRGSFEALMSAAGSGYYFDAALATTHVKILDNAPDTVLAITW